MHIVSIGRSTRCGGACRAGWGLPGSTLHLIAQVGETSTGVQSRQYALDVKQRDNSPVGEPCLLHPDGTSAPWRPDPNRTSRRRLFSRACWGTGNRGSGRRGGGWRGNFSVAPTQRVESSTAMRVSRLTQRQTCWAVLSQSGQLLDDSGWGSELLGELGGCSSRRRSWWQNRRRVESLSGGVGIATLSMTKGDTSRNELEGDGFYAKNL